MSNKKLTNAEISSLCMELALLLHAGLGISDGLHSLLEDAAPAKREMLSAMAAQTDRGEPLSAAMRESGAFPEEVFYLTEVGERSGRTEEALRALSDSYDAQAMLSERIRGALVYPSVLLLLMLVVIGVLLVRVLPVFNEVFESLGGELTGLAGGLLALGRALDAAMPAVLVILALAVAFLTALAASSGFRERLLRRWRARHGNRGISRKLAEARFTRALAMGMRSGLPIGEALELSASFDGGSAALAQQYRDACARLAAGGGLAESLRDSGALAPAYCRMLALGIRSGTGDTVIQEIARRLREDGDRAIDSAVSRVEPTLVIVTSLLVGGILLSVMLPLMNIMAAVG